MSENIKEKVFEVVSINFEVPVEEVNMESSPDTIESWDSLKHMNLVLALEEEFGVRFDDDQIVEMLSVNKIVEVIEKLV